jgi:hypothetical protein
MIHPLICITKNHELEKHKLTKGMTTRTLLHQQQFPGEMINQETWADVVWRMQIMVQGSLDNGTVLRNRGNKELSNHKRISHR